MLRASSLALALLACACHTDDVGIPCQLESQDQTDVVSIGLSAFDCRSRLCLRYGGAEEVRPLCTASCGQDNDCPSGTDACPDGFRCIYAKAKGATGCCRLCVCRRFIVEGQALEDYCQANPNPHCP